VAIRFGELDEPRTEGQLRVRALDSELVFRKSVPLDDLPDVTLDCRWR
jgi:hypothetical protein